MNDTATARSDKQTFLWAVIRPAGKQDWNLLSKSLYSKGFSASV